MCSASLVIQNFSKFVGITTKHLLLRNSSFLALINSTHYIMKRKITRRRQNQEKNEQKVGNVVVAFYSGVIQV